MKGYKGLLIIVAIAISILAVSAIKHSGPSSSKSMSFERYLAQTNVTAIQSSDVYFVFTPKTCIACMQGVLMNYSELLAQPNVAILSSGANTIPRDVTLLLDGKKNLYQDNTGELERSSFSKGGVVLVLAKEDRYEFFPLTPKNFSEVIDREIPTAASVSFRY